MEGKLFLAYCTGKTILTIPDFILPFPSGSPPPTIAIVESSEYIGGLSDLTGELGRLAVARASRRDVVAVEEILQANYIFVI